MDPSSEATSEPGLGDELPPPSPPEPRVVTAAVCFDTWNANLTALAVLLPMDPSIDRILFIDYCSTPSTVHAFEVERFVGYLERVTPEVATLRREPGSCLSDAWNSAGVIAKFYADQAEPEPAPWTLVLVHPDTIPLPGTVTMLQHVLDTEGAPVAFATSRVYPDDDGRPIPSRHFFDGRCFAVTAPAGEHRLLTTRDHDTLGICAHDFLDGLAPDAPVFRLDGYLLP